MPSALRGVVMAAALARGRARQDHGSRRAKFTTATAGCIRFVSNAYRPELRDRRQIGTHRAKLSTTYRWCTDPITSVASPLSSFTTPDFLRGDQSIESRMFPSVTAGFFLLERPFFGGRAPSDRRLSRSWRGIILGFITFCSIGGNNIYRG